MFVLVGFGAFVVVLVVEGLDGLYTLKHLNLDCLFVGLKLSLVD